MSEPLLQFLQHNLIVRYVSVAGATLLVYDYILTILHEINLIWWNKWNTGKILFLATRYVCFVDTALVLAYLFDSDLSVHGCKEVYNASAYLIVFGILIAEIIMSTRAYALWGRSKRFLYFMLTVFAGGVVVIVVFYAKKSNNLFWIPSPTPGIVPCHAQNADNTKVLVAFGLLMGYECVILMLTVWIGVEQWKEEMYESPLLVRFYRDGAVYFFVLFATSAANFFVRLREVGNGDYYDLLIAVQSVLHSLISSRMILNLRLAAQSNIKIDTDGRGRLTTGDGQVELTDVQFATPSQTAPEINESFAHAGHLDYGFCNNSGSTPVAGIHVVENVL